MYFPRSYHSRGFSLIEAAIVLAIVGLVIGGLWAATRQVRQSLMVTAITEDVLLISRNTFKLYRPEDMPSVNGTGISLVSTAMSAGVFPEGYVQVGSNVQSPTGVLMNLRAECWASICPRVTINIFGNRATTSRLGSEECYQLLRRIGRALQNTSFVSSMAVVGGDTTTTVWTESAPFTFASLSCPADFHRLSINFRP